LYGDRQTRNNSYKNNNNNIPLRSNIIYRKPQRTNVASCENN
jgi:hypothetical protein